MSLGIRLVNAPNGGFRADVFDTDSVPQPKRGKYPMWGFPRNNCPRCHNWCCRPEETGLPCGNEDSEAVKVIGKVDGNGTCYNCEGEYDSFFIIECNGQQHKVCRHCQIES